MATTAPFLSASVRAHPANQPVSHPPGILSLMGMGAAALPPLAAITTSPVQKPAEVRVLVGNKLLMKEAGVNVPQAVDDYMREMEVCSCTLTCCP